MAGTRAWHLVSRPSGPPDLSNFELEDIDLPQLGEDMVHVENRWLSVDPYMRGRMNDIRSYVPPFMLGEPLQGGAIGRVIESRSDKLAVGDLVFHMHGWREQAVDHAESFTKLPSMDVDDHQWLGNLGLTGATAYFGLLKVVEAKSREILFVSAAAGAVGSAVVQIAKIHGLKVIGSARGQEKCQYVRDIGADMALDYTAAPIVRQLQSAVPEGIDIYFDNVGSEHLDAAFASARQNARFAMCGMIDIYNSREPPCFRYISRIIAARITLKGFIYSDFRKEMPKFYRDMGSWIKSGRMKSRETIREGIEATPQAFLDLFKGANIGKMLIRL